MKTLVWFVQVDETLYMQTRAHSGKVKRIRNNNSVNISPGKMDGTPSGSWIPANAREVTGSEIAKKGIACWRKNIA